MEDEPCATKFPDNVAAKIFHADKSVTALHCRKIHAVHRHQTTGHDDAQKFCNQIAEMLLKLAIVTAIAHITVTVGVCIKRRERRRKDGVMDTAIRDSAQSLYAVALIQRIF